jgi:hypothetical protein
MGRGWAILEGGNRGNVLTRLDAAMCYGDLSGATKAGRIVHDYEGNCRCAAA